ncbi:MAG TPA: serine hydrolase domain-containing protein [Phytomonospora sp.]
MSATAIFRRIAITATAVATLAATVAAPAEAHDRTPSRPDLQAAIQSVVDQGFAGVQLRVDDEHGEWTGSAGVRELGKPAKPSTEGLFRVGSATKAFTSALVLTLVEDGVIGLDDAAVTHLPEWDLDPRITIRMLLQHTSGLFNISGEYFPDGTVVPGIPSTGREWVDNRFHDYTPEELVEFSLSRQPRFEPGGGWSYSNTNYIVLRLLVENVTGQSFPKAMHQRVLRPLGLRDTVLPEGRTNIPGPHAHGYYRYETSPGVWATVDVTRQNPTWLSTGGDMISSTEDLSDFLSALLDGDLVGEPLVAELLKPEPRSPINYGLGLSTTDLGPACGGKVVNTNGFINGYAAVTYRSLETGTTMSASITVGDAPIDFTSEGAVAIQNLLITVFCS